MVTCCGRTCKIPPWKKWDVAMLIGALVSSIVLITTCYCVWYPYLETSDFFSAECFPFELKYTGLTTCKDSGDSCSTVPPDVTLTIPSYHFNVTPWLTSAAVTSTAAATTTIATTTAANVTNNTSLKFNKYGSISPKTLRKMRQAVLKQLSDTEDMLSRLKTNELASSTCPWFPCIKLKMLYRSTSPYVYYKGYGFLFESYDHLQTYPQCSASSCTADNQHNIYDVFSWLDDYASMQEFACYANLDNTTQVITEVNGSYAAAVNSILWPILALITFGLILIFLRCYAYIDQNRAERPRETSADPYSINYAASEAPYWAMPPPDIAVGDGAEASAAIHVQSPFPASVEKNLAELGPTYGATGNPTPWVMHPPEYSQVSGDTRQTNEDVTQTQPSGYYNETDPDSKGTDSRY